MGISKVKKFEEFELHHEIFAFVLIFIATILITRVLVLVKDPSIIIKGYELHHLYYGLIILIVINLFMLFGKERYVTYFTLSAVSIGLIADEFFFVMGRKLDFEYVNDWPAALVFACFILLVIFGIKFWQKRK